MAHGSRRLISVPGWQRGSLWIVQRPVGAVLEWSVSNPDGKPYAYVGFILLFSFVSFVYLFLFWLGGSCCKLL